VPDFALIGNIYIIQKIMVAVTVVMVAVAAAAIMAKTLSVLTRTRTADIGQNLVFVQTNKLART